MQLPLVKNADDVALQLPRWKSALDPLLANPLARAFVIPAVVLAPGANVINHKLGRVLTGYIVILNNASATFYDSQSMNPTPQLTLILNASAAATVSLLVF